MSLGRQRKAAADMALVFFDFETGGVLPSHPNIQLAAVAVNDDFAEMESYEAMEANRG